MKSFSLKLEQLYSLKAFMNQYSYDNKYPLPANGEWENHIKVITFTRI